MDHLPTHQRSPLITRKFQLLGCAPQLRADLRGEYPAAIDIEGGQSRCGLSRSTIYASIASGGFPAPRHLGPAPSSVEGVRLRA